MKRKNADSNEFQSLPPVTNGLLHQWSKLWNSPDLNQSIHIEFSPRLTRSLGRCLPKRCLIRLNPILNQPEFSHLFEEVLCHEAAHYVVYQNYGTAYHPHGPEWRSLIEQAGFTPRVKIKDDRLAGKLVQRRSRSRLAYKHECPVCHLVWTAFKPMKNWRCPDCYHYGAGGELIITTYPTSRKAGL